MKYFKLSLLLMALGYLVIGPSRLKVQMGSAQDASLIFVFRSLNRMLSSCRDATEAEKSQMLAHMRQNQICERSKAETIYKIEIDGKVAFEGRKKPLGFRSDMASLGMETLIITPGTHQVAIFIRGTENSQQWDGEFNQEVKFDEGRRRLIEYQTGSGFNLL